MFKNLLKYRHESKKQADYIDISSSPSVGDDLIESDYNYRTDEVPVAETNRNDNHFLEKQGQRKQVNSIFMSITLSLKRFILLSCFNTSCSIVLILCSSNNVFIFSYCSLGCVPFRLPGKIVQINMKMRKKTSRLF
jgi:hypothetical protein